MKGLNVAGDEAVRALLRQWLRANWELGLGLMTLANLGRAVMASQVRPHPNPCFRRSDNAARVHALQKGMAFAKVGAVAVSGKRRKRYGMEQIRASGICKCFGQVKRKVCALCGRKSFVVCGMCSGKKGSKVCMQKRCSHYRAAQRDTDASSVSFDCARSRVHAAARRDKTGRGAAAGRARPEFTRQQLFW
jgi:hypothetical protein